MGEEKKQNKARGYQRWHVGDKGEKSGHVWKELEENGKHQDKHIQAIDLLGGIVLETGATLIKWKVILIHRAKLFANIHHWKLKWL